MAEGSNEATTRLYTDAPPDPAQVIRPSWPAWIGPTAWPAIASNFRRIQAASRRQVAACTVMEKDVSTAALMPWPPR